MKKTMLFSLAASALAASLLVLPAAAQETDGVTVTDMYDREITLDEPATRVVALSAADCEILCAIGAEDALVGRGEYCDWPESILEVPSVQSGYDTNIEQIISLEPQLLLMSSMAQTEEQVSALEEAGIRVAVSDAQDIEGTYEAITMIGALVGHDDEAAALVDSMKAAFAEVTADETADEDERPGIYFEVSPLQYGLWTAGSGTFMNEVAEMIGARNVFDDLEGWAEISEEQVIERAPDCIVTITMYFGEDQTPEEEIAARDGWENIPAVQNGRILRLENDELSLAGPRLVDGAEILYDFVFGDGAEASTEADAELIAETEKEAA